ncbi:hypothetical protein N9L47_04725 [Rhodobacteraceae bacterium]|nr:hypothetical protein [Paracoccaceae bacterium]
MRGGAAGGTAGAVHGFAEGEDSITPASGAVQGGVIGLAGGATLTGAGEGFTRTAQRLSNTQAGRGVIHTLDILEALFFGSFMFA